MKWKKFSVAIITKEICWLCGKTDVDITRHHAIPKKYNPRINIQIPLCWDCHDLLNKNGRYR